METDQRVKLTMIETDQRVKLTKIETDKERNCKRMISTFQ